MTNLPKAVRDLYIESGADIDLVLIAFRQSGKTLTDDSDGSDS